ncbi:MAG: hypothetical protein GY797_00460 [Deltaproteobacteria bacterium]|nr:hypothetical protein [Deltaproteobacteria bacterium]
MNDLAPKRHPDFWMVFLAANWRFETLKNPSYQSIPSDMAASESGKLYIRVTFLGTLPQTNHPRLALPTIFNL